MTTRGENGGDFPPHRYVVGIDLGTTNSAVAYASLQGEATEGAGRRIRVFEVPQLVNPGEVKRRTILPSFLYLPGAYDLPEGAAALPWDPDRDYVVGEFAREQGALVPGRLVSSAKSWLCHGGVDRTAPILPWGAGDDVPRVSPVEAACRYLQHIREAWNHVMAGGDEEAFLENQLVLLTVPASFDEVARELTVEAARKAGLPRVILLEEPLAAFYDWLSRNEGTWRSQMTAGQLILVCDVGGGTTDFTLVTVRSGEKGLRFDRLAVGDHLMLGGDNMDLTVARRLEMRLLGKPGSLDARRWHQLCHQCRKAKETLITEETSTKSMDVTVIGVGGKLIAGTLKGTLTVEEVEEWILEGFFPYCPPDVRPEGGRRTGITEWGLPYVQDPAVTHHLAAFWRKHMDLVRRETGRSVLFPDFVLFNGGALIPGRIRRRLRETVGSWFRKEAGADWLPEELSNPHPDLAVSLGAAYYGLVRLGEGVRVGAGSPRAYYVAVASAEASESEGAGDRKAVCLVPRGTEEGYESELESPVFEVLANQPAAFQLFSSSTRLGDRQGEVTEPAEEEITVLPPIRTVLKYGRKGEAQTLPVRIGVRLNEIGTLELWCQSLRSPHRWELQFDVRRQADAVEPQPGETLDVSLIDAARGAVLETFRPEKAGSVGSRPEGLLKTLVSILDLPKEKWPTSLIRKLADSLLECRDQRALTPQHEARWLNILGYCLRPGFGDPLDEWRMREVWKLYPQGVKCHRNGQCRNEWWIFWRRVSGGLTAGQQWHIYQQVAPSVLPPEGKARRTGRKPGLKVSPQEELEVWMMLASFERLPVDAKTVLGRAMLERLAARKPRPQELWTLSRIGSRVPVYGPLDRVVPAREAAAWMRRFLEAHPEPDEQAAHALIHLVRLTGDRARDVSENDRNMLAARLERLPSGSARFLALLNDPSHSLDASEWNWIFGESLPVGLRIRSEDRRQEPKVPDGAGREQPS
ncbi:MAG: Hsp70 family protein [Thermodesulfobacteriota bacterium]|nr:Hsp70 family protein [Thermodesulfobacteriota bacterium]